MKCKKIIILQKLKIKLFGRAFTSLLLSTLILSVTASAKNIENLEITSDRTTIMELIRDNIARELEENIVTQSTNKRINRTEIENIALKQFLHQRNFYTSHIPEDHVKVRAVENAYIENGIICYEAKGRFNTKNYYTPLNIDDAGNFSMLALGETRKHNPENSYGGAFGGWLSDMYYSKIVGTKRIDGYYNISVIGYGKRTWICDSQGNIVNQMEIRQRSQQYLLGELDKIQYLGDMNKDMISSILAGNDVYEIDYVQEGEKHTIYADKLDSNIEIRFVKRDSKTIYGVYIVSSNHKSQVNESNIGSKIYAFKYIDESTLKKQRGNLMIKQVVQYDFDDQNPSTQKFTTGTKGQEYEILVEFGLATGLFSRGTQGISERKLDNIYENFMCEGVIYTTYTKDNENIFYKNQQKIF